MIGTDKFSAGGSHVIGVNVVEFTVGGKPKAGCDGKKSLPPERFQQRVIDAGEIAHEAEAAFDIVVDQWRGGKAIRIGGADADGRMTRGRNRSGQTLVEQAGKDHDRYVARFTIGDSKTADELALNVETFERFSEEAPAAVDNKNLVTVFGKSSDVGRKIVDDLGRLKQGPRKFDNDFHSRPVCSFIPNITFRFWTA